MSAGYIKFDIIGENSQLRAALGQSERMISRFGQRVNQVFTGVALVILARKLYSLVGDLMTAYREGQQAEARLAAVVKATGEAAGFSADQLLQLAKRYEMLTGISKDLVVNSMTVLATFKDIRGDIFIQAQEAALNLADVLQTDLKTASLRVGKALEDPYRGLIALHRVGIVFTNSQKQLITQLLLAGNKIGAQRVILEQLRGTVGNAAFENDNFSLTLTKLNNRFNEALTTIGQVFVPVLELVIAPIRTTVQLLEILAIQVDKNKDAFKIWAAAMTVGYQAMIQDVTYWYKYTELAMGNVITVMGAAAAFTQLAFEKTFNVIHYWLTEKLPAAVKSFVNAIKEMYATVRATIDMVLNPETPETSFTPEHFAKHYKKYAPDIGPDKPVGERQKSVSEHALEGLLKQMAIDFAANANPKLMEDQAKAFAKSFKLEDPKIPEIPKPKPNDDPFNISVKKPKDPKAPKAETSFQGKTEGLADSYKRIFEAAAGRRTVAEMQLDAIKSIPKQAEVHANMMRKAVLDAAATTETAQQREMAQLTSLLNNGIGVLTRMGNAIFEQNTFIRSLSKLPVFGGMK